MIVKIKQVEGLQTALDAKVSGAGAGTLDYITKWSSTTGIIDSQLRDDGTSVGIAIAPSSFDKVLIDADSLSNGLKVQNNDSGYAIRTVSDGTNATSANISIEGIAKGATAAVGAAINIAGHFLAGTTVPIDITSSIAETFGAIIRAHESTKKAMALYVDATTSNTQDNIGLYVVTENVGAGNNYSIIVPSGGGNVGLGVSLPTSQLHVVGNFRLVDGTQADGYVLTSDASGNSSWVQSVTNTAFTVWVDATYGNDTTGLVENSNRPFQTIESALTALHAAANSNWTINIAPGTYNETTITTQDFNNYQFNCDKRTVINFSNTVAFNFTGSVSNDRYITIEGGRWFHNGTSLMFGGYQVNYFIIRNAHIQNNTGIGIFERYTLQEVYNCTIIGVVGWIFYGEGSGKLDTCYIEAQSDYVFNTAGALGGHTFANCSIKSLTQGISNNIGTGSTGTFDNCVIETSATVFFARGLQLYMTGLCIVKIIDNGRFINFGGNGAQEPRFLQFDTVIVNQSDANNLNSIQTDLTIKVDSFISNTLYITNVITSSQYAAAGIAVNGATIGNNIIFNLPSPFNGNPISYTIATSVVSDELDAIQALIEAEVINPTSDWYAFCEGRLDKVIRGVSNVRVHATENTPGGFLLRNTTNTVTSDETNVTEANLNWAGIFNHGAGDVVMLPKGILYYVGSTDRIIDRIRKSTKFNY